MSPFAAATRSVLVVQPDHEDPLDTFDSWFRDEGLTTKVVRPFADDPVPDVADAAGLVVLGGDMGANDDAAHPWLRDVRALLASAVEHDVPTLGICLGGQLLAVATGGEVSRGSHGTEVGAPQIHARPEVEDDVLLSAVSWPARFATMHRDEIVTLPAEAVWLAESSMYKHQAFRIGRHAWGLQFHPEVSLSRFVRWAEYIHDDPETTQRVQKGVAEFAATTRYVATATEPLARRFARVVRS
ncbi:MAG TPA: type 1 glutamine amidotransferase [Nocardioides sp.]|uniref:type 1 glutamine amidotransferase n=1 Tax=uncultured Nocardioides sp. TaxID=198441 RepID=UPI000EEFC10A|nr:type 1 glutamine amidotransferase [uncultured Nocardioides sp.]HAP74696.1 glutamine amidotransferase [Acidimicrobiaceae bacterium]HCB05904.1 glutamine amidotransferase [Nocardioides sp.]HRI95000.1 type 1 glutamine amidotransferase [Nocardioides sp.]HRK44268.1 type 1 glutamine amidotransferase [Nocardioides sp.]